MGTVIKKTSLPFKINEAFNAGLDQIQFKYVGNDAVSIGCLIEFLDIPLRK